MLRQSLIHPITRRLLLLCNLLFVGLYAFLAYHHRLALDDFHFIDNLNEASVWQATLHEYQTWSSRYSSVLLNHSVLSANQLWSSSLFVFDLLGLLGLFLSLRYFMKSIAQHSPLFTQLRSDLGYLLPLTLCMAIFFSSLSIADTWFWLCATCTYLWGTIAFIAALAGLLDRRASLKSNALTAFALIYLGGALAPLALLALAMISIGIIFAWRKQDRLMITRLGIACTILAAALAALILAEGNEHRSAFFESVSLLEGLWLSLIHSAHYLVRRLPTIALSLSLVLAASLWLGSQAKFKNKQTKTSRKTLSYSVLYTLVLIFYVAPISYKTQEVAALRTLFPMAIVSLIYLASIGYTLGKEIRKLPLYVLWGIMAVTLLSIATTTVQQVSTVSAYSIAYDARMHAILSHDDCDHMLQLAPLPDSGLLPSAEIKTNYDHFSNQHLMQAMDLCFPIVRVTADTAD